MGLESRCQPIGSHFSLHDRKSSATENSGSPGRESNQASYPTSSSLTISPDLLFAVPSGLIEVVTEEFLVVLRLTLRR
jgi:hypothetical protein